MAGFLRATDGLADRIADLVHDEGCDAVRETVRGAKEAGHERVEPDR